MEQPITLMPVRFDEPVWLFLLVLLIPVFLMSLRSIGGLSRTKAIVTLTIRSIVIVLLALTLAHPVWEKRGEGLTVTVLLDRSQSIPLPLKQQALEFLRDAAESKERREDRVGVVTIARDAAIAAMPDEHSAVTVGNDVGDLSATNLAEGVRLALAIMPDDTANRIVLASDGNETMDSVLAAAELAQANNVPIDVLLLEYEFDNEVIFDQIVAPARVRQGGAAELKLVLHSQNAATGTIRLSMNDEHLDLNGDEPGDGLRVQLDPGVNAISQTINLDTSGPHQFEAVFIPDEKRTDAIDRNNTAVAVTFVGGKGKILVVDDSLSDSQFLVQALREAGMTVEVRPPEALAGGIVLVSGYDAVILVNIPRWAFDDEQDRMLRSYVHDLGGGLVMVGGSQSFGAGQWIGSEVAKALPVKLDPPQSRQMPSGALALIMHSCEMPQGNFWGQKVAQSAIEALSRLDYAGIVEYGWGGVGGGGSRWAFPMQRLGDKVAALNATKTMQVGDMPAFGPSMNLALQGLTSVPAAQRHAIIISDGDPSPPAATLVDQFVQNKVTVTTVMVGGHGTMGDRNRMQAVANKTGGTFYNVTNPKQLPQIFIKEAQIVSRSLIQDGDVFAPAVIPELSGPTRGFDRVPAVDGYVLTVPRDGLAQTPIQIPTEEAKDPLFAHWNYGLGRSIAYTSDLTNLWGARWAGWERFRSFWEQAIRWVMRPSSPTNMDVRTRLDGDLAVVDVEAVGADAQFLNFLRTNAVVIRPDTESQPLSLQQTGPGRYRGQFRIADAGAYLVNIAYAAGSAEAGEQGNVQAAVTVPYPREFRNVQDNKALLQELAEQTGGRLLLMTDPQIVELFEDEGLPIPKTFKHVWDLLVILAASLLIIDVAARRLSVDPNRVRAAAGKAVGRRGDVSTETVAAWKRTRAQVAHRRDAEEPAGKSKSAAQELRQKRYEAGEEDLQRSIDVGGETPEDVRDAHAKAKRTGSPAETPGAGEDEGDFTSRLLKAKRRARGDDADGEDDPRD